MAAALTMSALSMFAARAAGQDVVIGDVTEGLAAWRSVESVLTHPRCLNCHTMTSYPRQGDERRPHALEVKRGPDGHGEGTKCRACHTDANQTATGIPGAKEWHMPPLALAWESEPGEPATGAAICATLRRADDDAAEPDFERLIEYAQLASFVQWAWQPGQRQDGTERSTPLLTHEEFVAALKRWISAGAPCPGGDATDASPSPVAPPDEAASEAPASTDLPTTPDTPASSEVPAPTDASASPDAPVSSEAPPSNAPASSEVPTAPDAAPAER